MRLLGFMLFLLFRGILWVLFLPLRLLFPALFRDRVSNMIAVSEDDPGMKSASRAPGKTLPDFIAPRLRRAPPPRDHIAQGRAADEGWQ